MVSGTKRKRYTTGYTWLRRPCSPSDKTAHLVSVGRTQGAVAVLGEAHLHRHVEGHRVFYLGEVLDDGDSPVDRLVRAAQRRRQRR